MLQKTSVNVGVRALMEAGGNVEVLERRTKQRTESSDNQRKTGRTETQE